MRWLLDLFKPSCRHEWEDIDSAERWLFGRCVGIAVFQRCKKCGDRRRINY